MHFILAHMAQWYMLNLVNTTLVPLVTYFYGLGISFMPSSDWHVDFSTLQCTPGWKHTDCCCCDLEPDHKFTVNLHIESISCQHAGLQPPAQNISYVGKENSHLHNAHGGLEQISQMFRSLYSKAQIYPSAPFYPHCLKKAILNNKWYYSCPNVLKTII